MGVRVKERECGCWHPSCSVVVSLPSSFLCTRVSGRTSAPYALFLLDALLWTSPYATSCSFPVELKGIGWSTVICCHFRPHPASPALPSSSSSSLPLRSLSLRSATQTRPSWAQGALESPVLICWKAGEPKGFPTVPPLSLSLTTFADKRFLTLNNKIN